MKEQIALLIALQALDSETVNIVAKKQLLPERIRLLEETYRKRQSAVDEAKQTLEDLVKRHRDQEEKLKRGAEGLKKAKQRLLDVKTNKEYQAILKEMESLESSQGKIEDEIISLLDQVDHQKVHLQNVETEFSTDLTADEMERKELEGQLQSLDGALIRFQKKRQVLLEKLPGALVKRYEMIRQKRNGLAVISVWKESCNGCHMHLPPQMYIELQRSQELRTCPNCHRIIYWQSDAVTEEP